MRVWSISDVVNPRLTAAGTEIPKKMLASLNPEDQKEFDAKKLESSSLDAKLAIATAGGANQDLLIKYGAKLTKQDRLIYLNQMNTAGSSPASFDQDTFSLLLRQTGFEELDNPKGDKDKFRALQIRDAVNTRIQMQTQVTGKDPSDEEKRKIMMRILTDKSYVPSGWFADSNVADVLLTKKQRESAYKNVLGRKVPIEKYEEITNILAGQKAEITEENILKMLEGAK